MTFAIWRAEQDVRLGEATNSDADRPAIAYLPNGGYVVGWREADQLKFKVYNGAGDSTGVVYSVDSGAEPENHLDIQAVGADGSFVVSWNAGTDSNLDLKTRVFSHNGDGHYVGGTINTVHENVTNPAELASLTSKMNGGFASTYMVGADVYFSMHDANGAKLDAYTYRVHQGQSGIDYPKVTQIAENKYVVSYGAGDDINFRILTTTQLGADITEPFDAGSGGKSQVVALKDANGNPDGRFAVVQSRGALIVAKFYDASGARIGSTSEVVLTNDGYDHGAFFDVTATRGGRIAVTYAGDSVGLGKIVLKVTDIDGVGANTRLILEGMDNQQTPTITEMTDGRLAVAWADPTRGQTDVSSVIVDSRILRVVVQGTDRNDYYVGSEYDDDELYGNGGNDTLVGGAGNDDLYGGAGADVFRGGEGSDTVSYIQATAGVKVYLWQPNGSANDGDAKGDTFNSIEVIDGSGHGDVMEGDHANNVFWAYGGDDTLKGHGGNDALYGGDGNDILHGGAGADSMEGGARNGVENIDILSYVDSTTGVMVDLETREGGGAGESKGDVFVGMDKLFGSVHNDVLYGRNTDGNSGESKDDTIFGAAGHDLILGRDGDDVLDGWEGNDTLEGGKGADLLDGGVGFDFASYASSTVGITASLGILIPPPGGEVDGDAYHLIEGLIGSQHDDTLYGSDDLTVELRGGAGNDALTGGGRSDTLEGGAGADILHGGNSLDFASYAHAGTGVLADLTNIDNDFAPTGLASLAGKGDAAGDVYDSIEGLIGSAHADALYGDAAANYLRGMGGHDVLVGRGGADTLDGGAGNDTYHVTDAADRVVETANNGTDTVIAYNHFSLMEVAHVENVTAIAGTAGLRLTGSNLSNRITGNGGKNTLKGEGGNDTINGGAGADTLDGGTGNDTFYVDSSGDQVIESSRGGTDRLYAGVSYRLAASAYVESMSTNSSSGTTAIDLKGNNIAQTITGNAGTNTLTGLGGNDVINGGSGIDRVYGGTGNDVLYGGGRDAKRDTFVFDTALRSNVDTIKDFSTKYDRIELDNDVFTRAGAVGGLKADAFVSSSRARDREDRIIYDKATGALYYDADGTGSAAQVKFAQLAKNLAMHYSDFIVIS